ncbi:MAG: UDP-glucose--hexose-1-phosphate uridylyltransferase [Acidobacteriaceae bacterium]
MFKFDKGPHRRWNPLSREWVLVSPQRTQRPWQGQVEKTASENRLQYDPECYLCPGNTRAGGHRNPPYDSTFVFDNDYSALLPSTQPDAIDDDGLIVAKTERGICRVICFSPRHDLTVSSMKVPDIRKVVEVWTDQYQQLGSTDWINHVQIFENRGAMMGASNPHPHCQIWANAAVPNIPSGEQSALSEFRSARSACMLCVYREIEQKSAERIVCSNEHFTALVPFWAVWPFEVLLLSNEHLTAFDQMDDDKRTALAEILKRITMRFDNIFGVSFPYSMGFHQRPTDGLEHPEWHFHAHFYPPLLRSASVRKFMVGYEMLAGPQRDITPEQAAERLRAAPEQPLQ